MPRDEERGGSDRMRDFNDIETVLHGPDDDLVETPLAAGGASKGRGFAGLDEFVRSLVEIGLVTTADLKRFADDSADGVLGLSRALVKAGKLTPYQAAAIYQKKSRGLLIGNYLILDKLGQGGMGVVFKARNRKSGRVGALKILPPSLARDRDAVLRFRREIEAASRLNHPNVVAAIDSDEDRGVHFLVMDYVEGSDLDQVVRARGPLPVWQAVECMVQAARGLEAAHARGIIHRDIKPGNLILDTAGSVRVLDLGLARIVEANNPFNKTAARLTQTGMYMGTVDFMAPEQAEDAHRVDHRADIYSLGCTLYFLLTGREPFPAATLMKRLRAHMESAAPSLRDARPDVSPALEACYQKMMAKKPSDRPRSMTEVIALLQASKLLPDDVAGRIAAPPKSRPELMVFNEAPLKRAGPPKTKAEPSIFARREEREGLPINRELNLEDLVMDVRSENPPATVKRRVTLVETLKPLTSLAYRARSQQTPVAIVALAAAGLLVVALLGIVVSRRPLAVPQREKPPPLADPDVVENPQPVEPMPPAQPEPKFTTIFDGQSGKGWMLCNRAPLPPENIQPDGLNPHNTGSYLVVYDQKLGDFKLDFDYKLAKGCNSGVFLRVSDLNNPVKTGIEVALDDTRHGDDRDSGAFQGLVAPKTYAQKPSGQWNHMTIFAQGPRLSVSLNDTEVSAIDLDQWTLPGKRPDGSEHRFKDLAVARLARSGYLGFQDLGGDCWFKNIVLESATGGSKSANPSSSIAKPTKPSPASLAEPADGPYVETARFVGHKHPWVEGISILPDGKSLLTACHDKTVRLWDLATGREMRKFWHPGVLRPVAACPDGRRAVSGCADGFVRLWDLATGQELRRLAKHVGEVRAVAVSPDGKFVLSGGADKTLRLLDVEKGLEVRRFEGITADVWSVAFSPDGLRVLAGGLDGVIRFGETHGGTPLESIAGHSERIWSATFAADHRHAVSAGIDGLLIYWDLDAKRVLRRAEVRGCSIRGVALQADGRHVVFVGTMEGKAHESSRGIVGFWDLAKNDPPRLAPGGYGHQAVALLPDGAVATADNGGLARVWRRSHALAAGRALTAAGERTAALADYQSALTERPGDARLFIERGRLLQELGRSSEADADFARAAQLVPDHPQLFLNAGWWVAGPYDADPKATTPIERETAPDPSTPPPPSGDKPRVWQRASPGMLGHVDLRKIFDADNVAAYALAIVYSQSEKQVVLLAHSDDSARIWLNGRMELEMPRATGDNGRALSVKLTPGRNTILVKVANGKGPYGFHLRISDEPECLVPAYFASGDWAKGADAYRQVVRAEPTTSDPWIHHAGAESLANLGRWKEAAAGFRTARALDPKNNRIREHLMRCYIALGDRVWYQPLSRETIENLAKDANLETRTSAIRTASVIPGALSDYAKVLQIAKKLMDEKTIASEQYHAYGAILFRAKQYQSAITFLKKAIDGRKGKDDPFDWVFLAMARHRLKLTTDKDAFKKAVSLAKNVSSGWELNAEIRALLEEARQELALP